MPSLKLTCALVGALLATVLLTRGETLDVRASRHAAAQVATDHDVARLGMATLGQVYLETTQSEPTATASMSALQALDVALDPVRRTGAMYPLRKAMEQLAGIMLFPIVIIAILHAVFTSGGSPESKLTKIAVQFFVVMAMLWGYTMWDYVLYRGVSQPLTKALSDGKVVESVVSAVGNIVNADNLGKGVGSPTEELSAVAQNAAGCVAEISRSNPTDTRAGGTCFDVSVPEVRRRMYARDLDNAMYGPDSSRAAFLQAHANPKITEQVATYQADARPQSGWSKAVDLLKTGAQIAVGGVDWVLGEIGKFMMKTVTGIILTIQNIVMAAVLWLAWLYVIGARIFMLCFAPLAITWGLFPGGADKPRKWFQGHAKIVLMPVGLSFALLIFYVINVAILTTPILGGSTTIGVGLRLGLFVGFLMIAFKGSTLTNLISGDVTAVAEDFGKAGVKGTLAVAGTSVAGLSAAAGGALGAGAAGAGAGGAGTAGAANMGRAAQAAQGLGGTAPATQGFEYGTKAKAARSGLLRRMGSKAGSALRSTGNEVANTGRSLKWAWDNVVVKPSEINGPGDLLKTSVARPFTAARADAEKRRDERRSQAAKDGTTRLAATDDATSGNIDQGRANRQKRRARANQHKIQSGLRAGEGVPVDWSQVRIHDKDDKTSGAASVLGTMMFRHIVEPGGEFNVRAKTENGVREYQADRSSKAQLVGMYDADTAFAAQVDQEMIRTFGADRDKWPTVPGVNGPVPDFGALMRHSTAFANAAAAVAQASEMAQAETFRRSTASHFAGAKAGSVLDQAVRTMDPAVATLYDDEDPDAFAHRLQTAVADILREVSDRTGRSLADLKEGDAFTKGDAALQAATVQAIAAYNAQLQALRERVAYKGADPLGIDMDALIREGTERYEGESGSLYQAVANSEPALKANPARAYAAAVEQALSQAAAAHSVGEASRIPARGAEESEDAWRNRVISEVHREIFLSEATLSGQAS